MVRENTRKRRVFEPHAPTPGMALERTSAVIKHKTTIAIGTRFRARILRAGIPRRHVTHAGPTTSNTIVGARSHDGSLNFAVSI
jgi:hypothetical protein